MRKSRQLRLSQTISLIKDYEKAGMVHDRSYRFMQDMEIRLESGRGLSKGQRNYLDNLIEQGVPTPKNEDRVREILKAADVDGMQHVRSTLQDFAYKLGKGWSLSEKQEQFLNKLLAEAVHTARVGRFRPTSEMIKDLQSAVAICGGKNSWYWNHRPGTAKAYEKVTHWLAWYDKQQLHADIAQQTGKAFEHIDEPHIDQWVCDKLTHACKKQLKELKEPEFKIGQLLWTRHSSDDMALISDTPRLSERHDIVYPCLIAGEYKFISRDAILKRRPRTDS